MNGDASRGKRRVEVTQTRRFVLIAFTFAGVAVLGITLFAVAQTRSLEDRPREIVNNMLTSIRLVGRLDNAVERKRSLIDEHILTADPAEMARLEAQLAAIDARIAAVMKEYDPWADQPGERVRWDKTRADILALNEPIARSIALSREKRNVQARQAMSLAATRFEQVNADIDEIASINESSATNSLARFSRIRFRLTLTLLGVGLLGLAVTVLLARWVAAQVTRREQGDRVQGEDARGTEPATRRLRRAGRARHSGSADDDRPRDHPACAGLAGAPGDGDPSGAGSRRCRRSWTICLRSRRWRHAAAGHAIPLPWRLRSETFATRLAGENGALRLKLAPSQIACSEGLLRQALTNLTENAVKYRRPDVALEVEISGR